MTNSILIATNLPRKWSGVGQLVPTAGVESGGINKQYQEGLTTKQKNNLANI